jgi:hypothetical protein
MQHLARRPLLIALFCATALPAMALAQTLPPQDLPPQANNPAVRSAAVACEADIQKLCPDVQPGGGRIVRCLIGQRSAISPVCRDSILKAKAALGY